MLHKILAVILFAMFFISGECYVDHAGATLYSDTQIRKVGADLHGSLYANPHSIGIGSSSTQDIIERMRYR